MVWGGNACHYFISHDSSSQHNLWDYNPEVTAHSKVTNALMHKYELLCIEFEKADIEFIWEGIKLTHKIHLLQ